MSREQLGSNRSNWQADWEELEAGYLHGLSGAIEVHRDHSALLGQCCLDAEELCISHGCHGHHAALSFQRAGVVCDRFRCVWLLLPLGILLRWRRAADLQVLRQCRNFLDDILGHEALRPAFSATEDLDLVALQVTALQLRQHHVILPAPTRFSLFLQENVKLCGVRGEVELWCPQNQRIDPLALPRGAGGRRTFRLIPSLRAEGLHVITREERPAEGAERHHSSPLLPDTHYEIVVG
mmetsp:Transcript_76426/g.183107  ORF Transcript_76426/g.183107 Transcript_76426/m.183107 type:complete len:238 (-) Transcript_76426:713-1426(-)